MRVKKSDYKSEKYSKSRSMEESDDQEIDDTSEMKMKMDQHFCAIESLIKEMCLSQPSIDNVIEQLRQISSTIIEKISSLNSTSSEEIKKIIKIIESQKVKESDQKPVYEFDIKRDGLQNIIHVTATPRDRK